MDTRVHEERLHSGNLKRVIEFALVHIRLAENGDRSTLLGFEESFHCRQSSRLMRGNHLALNIASSRELHDSGDDADDDSDAKESFCIEKITLCQDIKSADRDHHEATRLHGAEHVVRILTERPGIQDETPETGKSDFAVRKDAIADGMLHPGVGRND